MNEIDIIEGIYRDAAQPVAQLKNLAIDLQHWYLKYPANNYLQPCVIDGKASLVCQKQLSNIAADAYLALKAICEQYGIYLKEDARDQNINPEFGHCRRRMAVVLTFCIGLMAGSDAAGANEKTFSNTTSLVDTQSHPITQLVKNQTLSEITQKISHQTGIGFKFNVAVQDDLINKKIIAQDWNGVLTQLLQDYNYSTIQERNVIKTVFITGYKGGQKPVEDIESNGSVPADLTIASEDSLGNNLSEVALDNRVTMEIEIPTDQLAELPEGGEMIIDLPVGTFNIKQENMGDAEDGTLCWIGTMEGGNDTYRLYLAKTQEGDVVGNVYTPNGAYNIETIDGQTVMIEIDQISMR